MPEVVKRIGPMRLVFDVVQCGDDVHVLLNCIGWADSMEFLRRPAIWDRNKRRDEITEFDRYEDVYGPTMLNAAREAIERERADMRREDAERYVR